jgi:alkylation response protein AidB-like acyl-CoA dehydrogenase
MARLYCAYTSQKVTSTALKITGASGYTTDNLVNVFFRDASAGSIVGGTDNIQKMIIASLL